MGDPTATMRQGFLLVKTVGDRRQKSTQNQNVWYLDVGQNGRPRGPQMWMSSLVLTIHNFGVPNFDPYPFMVSQAHFGARINPNLRSPFFILEFLMRNFWCQGQDDCIWPLFLWWLFYHQQLLPMHQSHRDGEWPYFFKLAAVYKPWIGDLLGCTGCKQMLFIVDDYMWRSTQLIGFFCYWKHHNKNQNHAVYIHI